MQFRKIIIVKIDIPEIEKRNNDDVYELNDSYHGEELLSEVHDLTLKVLPYPKDIVEFVPISNWHLCNIFGYRYTHGLIGDVKTDIYSLLKIYIEDKLGKSMNSIPERVKIIKKYNNEFHYTILKSKQDEILEKIKEKYLNYDIIATLKAFDIDPVKFWYVFLWVRDYVYTNTVYIAENANIPLEELRNFVKIVKANMEENGLFFYGDLILNSKSDKPYTLKNVHSIELIAELIERFLDNYNKDGYSEDWLKLHSSYVKNCSPDNVLTPPVESQPKQTDQLFLFNKCMRLYLDGRNGMRHLSVGDVLSELKDNKDVKAEGVSVDKSWLISRLACIADFAYEKDLYDFGKKENLKNKLKRFNASKFKKYHPMIYKY